MPSLSLGLSPGSVPIQRRATIELPFVSISADQVSDLEGDSGTTVFTFTVTRSGDLSGTSTVDYTASGGEATADDFDGGVFPSGTITFDPTESSKTITVNVAGDTDAEFDETFYVELSNPTNAQIDSAAAAAEILTDDPFTGYTWTFTDIGFAEVTKLDGGANVIGDETGNGARLSGTLTFISTAPGTYQLHAASLESTAGDPVVSQFANTYTSTTVQAFTNTLLNYLSDDSIHFLYWELPDGEMQDAMANETLNAEVVPGADSIERNNTGLPVAHYRRLDFATLSPKLVLTAIGPV